MAPETYWQRARVVHVQVQVPSRKRKVQNQARPMT